MTNTEWAKCVLVLRAVYGASFKLDAEGQVIWFGLLADLPGDRVIDAVKHMAKSTPAFPSVAEIRRLAEPAPADPGDAWRLACDYVSHLALGPLYRDGELQPLPTLEPWIKSAVESVGVESIRNRTPETENTLRAHFVKFYAAKVDHQRLAASGLRVLEGGKPAHIGDLLAEVKP